MISEYLMDYLAKAEGDEIHRNSTENDITSMYGIYRFEHPDAEIFKEIDKVALNIGISNPSSEWDTARITMINDYIKRNGLEHKFKELARSFYSKYINIPLEKFPKKVQVAIFSIYVTSSYYAVKSIQEAMNLFITNGFVDEKPILVDGHFGPVSMMLLEKIINKCNSKECELLFESWVLLNMSKEYAKLVVKNPSKYLKYLNGWNNRLLKLAKLNT